MSDGAVILIVEDDELARASIAANPSSTRA